MGVAFNFLPNAVLQPLEGKVGALQRSSYTLKVAARYGNFQPHSDVGTMTCRRPRVNFRTEEIKMDPMKEGQATKTIALGDAHRVR